MSLPTNISSTSVGHATLHSQANGQLNELEPRLLGLRSRLTGLGLSIPTFYAQAILNIALLPGTTKHVDQHNAANLKANVLAGYLDALEQAVTELETNGPGDGSNGPTLIDSFTKANGTQLNGTTPEVGGNWAAPGALYIGNGNLYGFDGLPGITPDVIGPDCYIQAVMAGQSVDGQGVGLVLRCSEDRSNYVFLQVYADRFYLSLATNGAGNVGNKIDVSQTVADGDTVRLEVQGNTMTGFKNGTQVITYTINNSQELNTLSAAGHAGVRMQMGTTILGLKSIEAGEL